MYNKVFISYATEDYKYANNLHQFLLQNGYKPWMDKQDILPGQNWDFQIQQALRKADFIILLLSAHSVGKRGYVQREFNQAIIYCEEKLDSDIYIIPIKIDECEIPPKLRKFQWVEYTSENAMLQILNAIDTQRNILISEMNGKKYLDEGLGYGEMIIRGRYGEKNPYMIYEIYYPKFTNEANESIDELNSIIKYSAVTKMIEIRSIYFNFLKFIDSNDPLDTMDSTEYESTTIHFLNKTFISFTQTSSSYSTGAAHGIFGSSGNNYYLNPLFPFKLEQLFEDFESCLVQLRDCIHEKLMQKAKTGYEEDLSEDFYIYDEGFQAISSNFENYYFKTNSLVFIYNPYELTAWSMGDHHPEITFEELLKLFPNEAKLHRFTKLLAV